LITNALLVAKRFGDALIDAEHNEQGVSGCVLGCGVRLGRSHLPPPGIRVVRFLHEKEEPAKQRPDKEDVRRAVAKAAALCGLRDHRAMLAFRAAMTGSTTSRWCPEAKRAVASRQANVMANP
jgi:hypothetical protein